MSWKQRRSSFLQGTCGSAKDHALVKVRRLWLGLLRSCVFLVSTEAKWCYAFWMVGICMMSKTSYNLNFWGLCS